MVYRSTASRTRSITAKRISEHYADFGVESLPLDCASFLRLTLAAVTRARGPREDAEAEEEGHAAHDAANIRALFEVSLRWKVECPECNREKFKTLLENPLENC